MDKLKIDSETEEVLSHLQHNDLSFFDSSNGYVVCGKREDVIVLEGQSNFYKIQSHLENDPKSEFLCVVKQAIVNEYKVNGLDWDFFRVAGNLKTYSVEKREKLELASDNALTFEDVMMGSREIKRRIENRLEFPHLLSQLKQYDRFARVKKIELVFVNEGDLSNYAYIGENLFLLGDSQCFLALINDAGRWEKQINDIDVPVSLSYGNFIFKGEDAFNYDRLPHQRIFSIAPKWWLFPSTLNEPATSQANVVADLEALFKDNAKVLTTKKELPLKTLEDFWG